MLCNSVNLGANESLVDLTPLKQLMVFPSLHHPSTLEQNRLFFVLKYSHNLFNFD